MLSLRLLVAGAGATLAVALTPALASADSCPNADLQPDASHAVAVQAATLCLLNAQRAANGMPPLVESPVLDQTSTTHTNDMVAHGYFAHTSPSAGDLTARLTAIGYVTPTESWSIGENIGWGTGPLATPGAMVVAWMNSPEHRANILDPDYREIGLGVAPAAPVATGSTLPAATYTTDFGVRSGQVSSSPAAMGPRATFATRATPAVRRAHRAGPHRRTHRRQRGHRPHRAHRPARR